jgi:hypothetical protein
MRNAGCLGKSQQSDEVDTAWRSGASIALNLGLAIVVAEAKVPLFTCTVLYTQ